MKQLCVLANTWILTLLITVAPGAAVDAQEPLSEGCEFANLLDGVANGGLAGVGSTEPLQFFEGERIIVTTSVMSGAPSGTFWLEFPIETIAKQGTVPGSRTYVIAENVVSSIAVFTNAARGNSYAFETTCLPPLPEALEAAPSPSCENVADGRINNSTALDCGAPIAIYDVASYDIYVINPGSGTGVFAIHVGDDVLNAPRDPAEGNVLLENGTNPFTNQPIRVDWLAATNEIQVSTSYADGKPYIVAWPVDGPEQLYHIAA
jgi:hypothetical protein